MADLDVAKAMFEVLEQAAKVESVFEVFITYRLEGGDLITVGYGEQAEPAILAVERHNDGSPHADA